MIWSELNACLWYVVSLVVSIYKPSRVRADIRPRPLDIIILALYVNCDAVGFTAAASGLEGTRESECGLIVKSSET